MLHARMRAGSSTPLSNILTKKQQKIVISDLVTTAELEGTSVPSRFYTFPFCDPAMSTQKLPSAAACAPRNQRHNPGHSGPADVRIMVGRGSCAIRSDQIRSDQI